MIGKVMLREAEPEAPPNPPLSEATLLDLFTAAALAGLAQTLFDPEQVGHDARQLAWSALRARAADPTHS